MRWGVEKRLEFIEFRLFWEGGINRADLMDQFGVSVPQASKDLSLYEERAPGNLSYDKRQKRYLASPSFKPVFLKPEADLYLRELRSVTDDPLALEETWLAEPPEMDAMPVPHRRIDVSALRSFLKAVREQRSLEVLYQSMNPRRADPQWRWITPHAFAHDGLRWHVRAYCHIDRRFKDFLMSRCLETRALGDAGAKAEDDKCWSETFAVVLKPNPQLSKSQQTIVAQDYEMSGGKVEVPVRKALLYYFQKRLRLDAAAVLDGPQETQVVIANQAEFERALVEASA